MLILGKDLRVFAVIFLLAFGSFPSVHADDHFGRTDSTNIFMLNPDPNGHPTVLTPGVPAPGRIFTDGLTELSIKTINPINVNVMTSAFAVAGTIEASVRHQTDVYWMFNADPSTTDDQHLFDDQGQAILVPGTLSCRVAHRTTFTDYKRAGLLFGAVLPYTVAAGGSIEEMDSSYNEAAKICTIGPIPKYTTSEQISTLCKSCRDKIMKTLVDDANAHAKTFSYLVKRQVCQKDNQCSEPNPYHATRDRCVLAKDKNGSFLTECQARSTEGGACRGPGASGLFQYPCDSGLSCEKEHEGKGFWDIRTYDYSRYVCKKADKNTTVSLAVTNPAK